MESRAGYQRPQRGGDGYDPRLGTLMGEGEAMNLTKDLMKPGKEIAELLMKTRLIDDNELRDVILTYSWLDEHELDEEKTELIMYLAGKCSVDGWRAFQVVEALTGIMAEAIPSGKARKRERPREPEPQAQQF